MGVRVFIESKNNSFCEQIAYFKNESDYDVCFKALEKKAIKDEEKRLKEEESINGEILT